MDSARSYPAIELTWPAPPDDELTERIVAELDEWQPTALESIAHGVRIFFRLVDSRDAAIAALPEIASSASVTAVLVPDESWAERSQARITLVEVERIVVRPPWVHVDGTGPGAPIVITIQPSMGFGTGHHESTRLCLRLLQAHDIAGAAVLDIGTGSGVLAIAATRLGATHVQAVDTDPDALTSARENLELNDIRGVVNLAMLEITEETSLDGPYDIITANLSGALLERFAPRLAEWCAGDGVVIASGFQLHEVEAVVAAFAVSGLAVTGRLQEHDWAAISASPRPSTAR